MARWNQAMLNALLCTFLVKSMMACRLFFFRCKTTRELRAIVGEDSLNFHRTGFFNPA
jgi:hypothetical protein